MCIACKHDYLPLTGSCSETENDSDIKLHFVTKEINTSHLNPDEVNFGQQAAVKSNKISIDAKPKPATKGSSKIHFYYQFFNFFNSFYLIFMSYALAQKNFNRCQLFLPGIYYMQIISV